MQLFAADVYEVSPFSLFFEALLEMCVWTRGVELQGTNVAKYQWKLRRKEV
jgi:hypothetical protein